MGDKLDTLVISVDLSCCRCRQAIQDYLCQLQRKQCMRIVSIVYDEKNNNVVVSGPFDPEQLKRKLLCKLRKIIICIDIRKPPAPPPPPPPRCDESKCIKNCKKRKCECECKCKCECEHKCKCKCECECERKCKYERDCDCDCKKKDPPKPKPPTQVTLMVCCARPCPCFKPWSNCYICCSCGVESWPGRCGPGWGSGPSYGGHPPWGNCESSQPPKIICESMEPPCSIM